MYDRILVPTDGSEYADDAVERALELASAVDATLHTVCVVEVGPLGSVTFPGDEASAREVLNERASDFVEQVARRAQKLDVPVTTEVREGIPVRTILEYVDEIDADAVVMGTRGRGGLSRAMLGSVTDGVIRHGDVDVLVVDHDDRDA